MTTKQEHEWKMIEIEAQKQAMLLVEESKRRTAKHKHELELERFRIKNAEIKKNILRKEARYYGKGD